MLFLDYWMNRQANYYQQEQNVCCFIDACPMYLLLRLSSIFLSVRDVESWCSFLLYPFGLDKWSQWIGRGVCNHQAHWEYWLWRSWRRWKGVGDSHCPRTSKPVCVHVRVCVCEFVGILSHKGGHSGVGNCHKIRCAMITQGTNEKVCFATD